MFCHMHAVQQLCQTALQQSPSWWMYSGPDGLRNNRLPADIDTVFLLVLANVSARLLSQPCVVMLR